MLCVRNNLISALPRGIQYLHELRVFDCSFNQIATLPPLQNLKNLKHFQCYDNMLSDIENVFGNGNQSLELLNLSQNYISVLPDSIGSIPNLTYLDLERNRITNVPESLNRLKFLKFLFLGFNGITRLPAALSSASALEELHLQENQIAELPPSFRELKNLKVGALLLVRVLLLIVASCWI